MRKIVSEDMIFTHMSGKTQSREEYFAAIRLRRKRGQYKMRKRGLLAIILALCLLLAGCGQTSGNTATDSAADEKEPQTILDTDNTESTPDTSSEESGTQSHPNAAEGDGYPVFDFENKTVTLNSGYEMPILGLGMFSLSDSEAENSTYWALKAGFRLIDTARIYGNEAAIQNIYSMVERDSETEIIPYCMENNIGFVPFSPIASGLLSGKITPQTQFERNDDVRNWVPQLSRRNIEGNQPIVEMLKDFAGRKNATPAQISLAWMLHKYPNVVPIPGSKNKERIIENLDSAKVELSDEEFKALEDALNGLRVYGHRGLGGF